MSVKKEELGGNLVRLTVTVPPEVFQDSIEKAYRRQRHSFSRPGFRKGNVPRAVIEAANGPDTFYNAAMELLLPNSLQKAYEEADLNVVSDADIVDIPSISRNDGVTYVVQVYVMPEVELGPFEGLEAVEQVYTVLDSDVDREIERVRLENARWVPVQRNASKGDRVVVDYSGTIDGVAFEGGSDEGMRLELGSGTTIPGFEDGIVGMVPGDERQIDVVFPEDYPDPKLAGASAQFSIHLHEVTEQDLPALDDDFAQDVSAFDTLSEYREDVRSMLQNEYDEKKNADVEAQLVSQVVEGSTVDVPPPMIERRVEQDVAGIQLNLARQGIPLEMYLEINGMTLQQLKDRFTPSAEQRVRTSLVLEKLVERFGTSASQEDVDAELSRRASEGGLEPERMLESATAEERAALQDLLTVRNTLERLKELSNITQKVIHTLDEFSGREDSEQRDAENDTGMDTERLVEEQS